MKNLIFIISIFIIIYSCSKTESTPTVTPPVVNKLSGCDSIKQGLLKTTSDTVRLVSCVSITGCDSVRLGILKPNTQDTLRLLTCIKITGCDSLRLGILKPNSQDTLRLFSCIKISSSDSMRLGLINIGQWYQGGIVAYILKPGDPGYDVNTKHGIIAAATNQSDKIWWYNGYFIETKATGTAIGTGLSNTNLIIASQGSLTINYAAGLARAYKGGDYTDWHLPSKDELIKLSINRLAIGGFSGGQYWSSSEVDSHRAWSLTINIGVPYDYNLKGGNYFVRAIRSF